MKLCQVPEKLPDKPCLHSHHLGQERSQVQRSSADKLLNLYGAVGNYGAIMFMFETLTETLKGIARSMMDLELRQENLRQGRIPTFAHPVVDPAFLFLRFICICSSGI